MAVRLGSLLRLASPMHRHLVLNPANRSQFAAFHQSHHRWNENIITIQDEADFKSRVLESSNIVLVDFHASWCQPCKLLTPRLESLVGSKNGEFTLAKVDIDELQDLALEYGVDAVPSVISFISGKKNRKFVGLKDDDEIDTFLHKVSRAAMNMELEKQD